jgi:fermentation-respiration switch protein FrsA (DUF1100 family)
MSSAPPALSASKPPKPLWFRILRIGLVSYVGIIIVLLLLENYLVYHPTRAANDWRDPPDSRVRDIVFPSADGTKLHGWWFPQENAEIVLLYCHGNAGNISHRSEMMAAWNRHMNCSIFIFDYPGYGKSEGKPSEDGCLAAGEAAYNWLVNEAGVKPDRIILYGKPLGGAIATDLASRRPHRALVLFAPFTSMPDMAQKLYPWLPARWLIRHKYDNLSKIVHCTKPVFIAHGDRDSLVPISQGERLFAAANEPKRFYRMAGQDHFQAPNDPAFFAALRQFLSASESRAAN